MRSLVGTVVTAIACAVGLAGSAAADPALLSLPRAPDGGPLVVRVDFALRTIDTIDDEAETFEFEAVLTLEWHDARQAFDPAAVGVSEKLYQGDYQFHEVFTGWFPQLALVNESGLYDTQGVLLRVRPDGSLRLVQMVDAVARTDFDLRAHPFDHQRLEAVFEVLGFDEGEVVLEPLSAGDANVPSGAAIGIPQWSLGRVASSVGIHRASHAGTLGRASTLVASIDVERQSLFMVRLVMVPLLVIVALSWSVFWMDQSSVGDRVNVSFVGILTVVAYQIVLSETLPRISYPTLMDGFLNVSFLVVCASVLVNLRVSLLDRSGRTAEGDRIDRRCRWLFPLVYVGLLGLVSLVALVVVQAK